MTRDTHVTFRTRSCCLSCALPLAIIHHESLILVAMRLDLMLRRMFCDSRLAVLEIVEYIQILIIMWLLLLLVNRVEG